MPPFVPRSLQAFLRISATPKAAVATRTRWIIRFVTLLLATIGLAQTASTQVRTSSFPVARVQSRVDNTQRVTLPGHSLPVLHNASDLGRVSAGTAMNHMVMVLQASPEQDHALQTLIDQQLDKHHANFHQWLTPDQFGAHFGVADADITKVTDWLTDQGFTVEKVASGKRFIQFSGNVGQVESAFQTEMHHYSVNGETHVANSRDISIPAALKPVISGVPTLHDFFKKPNFQNPRTASVTTDPLTGKVYEAIPYLGIPDFTFGTSHFVGAADFATIYNTTPLIQAGFDGTGVTIGIIGRTDIHLEDVQVYRELFGLKNNDPICDGRRRPGRSRRR